MDKSSCSWLLSALYSVSNLLGEHCASWELDSRLLCGRYCDDNPFWSFWSKKLQLHFALSVQERKTVKQNTLVSCYGLYTLSVRSAFRVSCISGMENYSKRTGCCALCVVLSLQRKVCVASTAVSGSVIFRCPCIRKAANQLYASNPFDLSTIWCIGFFMDDDRKNLISKIDFAKIRKSNDLDDGPGDPSKKWSFCDFWKIIIWDFKI